MEEEKKKMQRVAENLKIKLEKVWDAEKQMFVVVVILGALASFIFHPASAEIVRNATKSFMALIGY